MQINLCVSSSALALLGECIQRHASDNTNQLSTSDEIVSSPSWLGSHGINLRRFFCAHLTSHARSNAIAMARTRPLPAP